MNTILLMRFFFVFSIFISIFFRDLAAQNTTNTDNETLKNQIKILDSLGQYCWETSAYTLALVHYHKALPLAEKINDEKWQARILNYLGVIYENKGEFAAAFKHHFQSLKLREKSGNNNEIAISYVNIGITFMTSGQPQKALEYYFKCLKTNQEADKSNGRIDAHAYYHISTAYKEQKNYDKARDYAKKSLELATKIKENVIIIDVQNGLGLIETAQKNYEKGREYYQKVFDLATSAQDFLILTNNLLHFAENYQQSNDIPKAFEYAQKSLILAQKHELKAEEKSAYQLLSSLYATQGDFQQAYLYEKKFNVVRDTLFNLQKNQQISEITTQYETVKKEQQIEILEKDKKISKNTILGLVLGLILVMIISTFIFYGYQTRQTIQKQQATIIQAEKTQLEEKLILEENLKKIKEEQYNQEMAHNQRELASNALHVLQKNEMLTTLQEKLNDLSGELKIKIKPFFQEIKNNIDLDKDWNTFQLHFTQVHPVFFTRFQQNFPTLSQNDLKLLAYIRMNISNKEIANMLNITAKSVEMSRYRLKKKLNLSVEDNLDEWIVKYE